MANYLVSYDLNGSVPTHQQMDEHMSEAGWSYGRILETVWYVGTHETANQIFEHVNVLLSNEDQLIVVRCDEAVWRDLLISDDSLERSWRANAA